MKLKLTAIMAIAILFLCSKDKSIVCFEGEDLLQSCLIDIPLTYKKKDDKIVEQRAGELKGKEIILLKFDKNKKEVCYNRFYLGSEVGKEGTLFSYLILAKNPGISDSTRYLSFHKFQPKTERFYLSSCFDSTMKKHPEILAKYKELVLPLVGIKAPRGS